VPVATPAAGPDPDTRTLAEAKPTLPTGAGPSGSSDSTALSVTVRLDTAPLAPVVTIHLPSPELPLLASSPSGGGSH
jgi:hypothetical protein